MCIHGKWFTKCEKSLPMIYETIVLFKGAHHDSFSSLSRAAMVGAHCRKGTLPCKWYGPAIQKVGWLLWLEIVQCVRGSWTRGEHLLVRKIAKAMQFETYLWGFKITTSLQRHFGPHIRAFTVSSFPLFCTTSHHAPIQEPTFNFFSLSF